MFNRLKQKIAESRMLQEVDNEAPNNQLEHTTDILPQRPTSALNTIRSLQRNKAMNNATDDDELPCTSTFVHFNEY